MNALFYSYFFTMDFAGRFTVPQRLQSTTTTQQSESQANPPTQQQPELSGDNDMVYDLVYQLT